MAASSKPTRRRTLPKRSQGNVSTASVHRRHVSSRLAAIDPDSCSAVLRAPFSGDMRHVLADVADQSELFLNAHAYLTEMNPLLGIPAAWLADLLSEKDSKSTRSGAHLRWLPLDENDLRNSFAYTRVGKGKSSSTMLVLLATLV